MSATVENKKQAFLDNFSEDKNNVNVVKQEALKALENLEFPTTREEYWKYTRVGKIVNQKNQLVAVATATFNAYPAKKAGF